MGLQVTMFMSTTYSRYLYRLTYLAAILALISIFAIPQAADAFTLALPATTVTDFMSNLPTTSLSPTVRAEEKISSDVDLPDYDFSQTGHIAANSSPITQTSTLTPKKKSNKPVTPKIRPTLDTPLVMEGEASYYSWDGCLGCNPLRVMANGQQLNDNALTMAIGADKRHLVGYKARVTNLATDKSVEVLITDTGGFYQDKYGNRVADLTIATKNAIGMRGGTAQVKVEVF